MTSYLEAIETAADGGLMEKLMYESREMTVEIPTSALSAVSRTARALGGRLVRRYSTPGAIGYTTVVIARGADEAGWPAWSIVEYPDEDYPTVGMPDLPTPGAEFTSQCPHCGELGTIMEIDKSIRWNRLGTILRVDDHHTEAAASCGDGDWESAGWACEGCGREDMVAPKGFEITEWY